MIARFGYDGPAHGDGDWSDAPPPLVRPDDDEDDLPDFDPELAASDPLGDFGLDDEEAQPDFGDFWIEPDEDWGGP
jgi:hypothetical protein